MTNDSKTDHAAEARRGLKALRKNLANVLPASEKRGGFTNDERLRIAQVGATVAQVEAQLALVEQQRIANLIAVTALSFREADFTKPWTSTEDTPEWVAVRDEVAKGLGL